MVIEKVTNTEDFTILMETIRYENDLSYLDAVVFYCEYFEVEVESVTKMISKSVISGIYKEAMELNLMKDKQPLLI